MLHGVHGVDTTNVYVLLVRFALAHLNLILIHPSCISCALGTSWFFFFFYCLFFIRSSILDLWSSVLDPRSSILHPRSSILETMRPAQVVHYKYTFISILYSIGPICRGSALRPSMQSTFHIFCQNGFIRIFLSSSHTSNIANMLLRLFSLLMYP